MGVFSITPLKNKNPPTWRGFVSNLNRPLRAVFFRFFRPVVRFAPGIGARSYNRRQARVASRHSFDIHTNQSKDKEQTWRFATTSS
ncbi:oxidoreductase, short chain dehydrogenase/reductase family [Burkholderia pseudomallei TSV28]|nr:oxidoreductase, short chain dehydrogenase/reductase family [Burkholderia pseudomallei TSV28]